MNDKFTSLFGLPKDSYNTEKENIEDNNEETTSMLSKIKSSVSQSIEVEVNYKNFFIVFITGGIFIFISFFNLPFIIFNPSKFSNLFSIGSFICLISFIFLYGTNKFFSTLFNKERIFYTIIYILSLIGGFVFTYLFNYYIIVLICSFIQIITIIIFFLTFIPGGYSGISIIINMLLVPFKNLFNKSN